MSAEPTRGRAKSKEDATPQNGVRQTGTKPPTTRSEFMLTLLAAHLKLCFDCYRKGGSMSEALR